MSFSEVKTEITHNGEIYYGKIGKIKSASFGFMDSSTAFPFASLSLHVEGVGWGVGDACGRVLWSDKLAEEEKYGKLGRGFEFVIHVLRLLDSTSIEDLKGKTVLTLWTSSNSSGGTCVGLANPYTDFLSSKQIILYDEYFKDLS